MYGSVTFSGNLRLVGSWPSPRRAGMWQLLGALSVEGDGVVALDVSTRSGKSNYVIVLFGVLLTVTAELISAAVGQPDPVGLQQLHCLAGLRTLVLPRPPHAAASKQLATNLLPHSLLTAHVPAPPPRAPAERRDRQQAPEPLPRLRRPLLGRLLRPRLRPQRARLCAPRAAAGRRPRRAARELHVCQVEMGQGQPGERARRLRGGEVACVRLGALGGAARAARRRRGACSSRLC